MNPEVQTHLHQILIEHFIPLLKVALAIFTVLGGSAIFFLRKKVPVVNELLEKSAALSAFRSVLGAALKASAAKLMNKAQAIHDAYDASMAEAAKIKDPGERALAEAAAGAEWDRATEALAHAATVDALEEVAGFAPPWVRNAYKMGRALLEEVLPEVQRIFRRRS